MPFDAPPSSAPGLRLSQVDPKGQWFFGPEPRISSCCSRPELCQPGDLLVLLEEFQTTDAELIRAAIDLGATAILCERPFPSSVPIYVVDDCRATFGKLCHALARFPSRSLRTVGITGSYGKTTVQRLLMSIAQAAEQSALAIDAKSIETHGSLLLAQKLADARAEGNQIALIEASSQSLSRQQMSGIQLDAAVITNVAQEHVEWHGGLNRYHAAKARLLQYLKPNGFAVINADDMFSAKLLPRIDAPVITFAMHNPAELTATVVERHPSEQTFLMDIGDESIAVRTAIIGDGHIYNCLAAAAVALVSGIDPTVTVRGLEAVGSLPCCLQRVECGQPYSVFIDRIHTPQALANALNTLRPLSNGTLTCLIGVDHRTSGSHRAQQGRVLERCSDQTVLTASHMGRSMALNSAHDVLDGFDRPAQAHVMPDRARAICWTLAHAQPGDIVLLAGGIVPAETDPLVDEDVCRYWLLEANSAQPCPWVPA
jgi:UDP-N-acetylmuramoyl-L-alanyl-D-glutamate--2,6-diaminopimelate ligase